MTIEINGMAHVILTVSQFDAGAARMRSGSRRHGREDSSMVTRRRAMEWRRC